MTHAKKGEGGGVCDPQVFCTSKNPSFLARWRVRGRPAVRGPAGTGSVGASVGEGALAPVTVTTGPNHRAPTVPVTEGFIKSIPGHVGGFGTCPAAHCGRTFEWLAYTGNKGSV